ncbi:MAG: prepilin-type N-terminal cleavage/methylation domain-containing protein [Magnetococcales bacterium]|nr:prepilin-type N-terminal cleavage/methylation domain-containing protein [Magnetococcales bacterium]
MNTIRTAIKKRPDAGFSLVEMAIVLVIIGLIVSAISVGKTTMRKGEATKAYQQYINPWIQTALNTYQGSGTASWGSNSDVAETYNFGSGVIKREANPTVSAGLLTIGFAFSGTDPDEIQELTGVFKNALSNSASSVTVTTTGAMTVIFNVPSYNPPGKTPKS